MIEAIKQQFTKGMTNEDKLNRAREYIQILSLKILDEKGFFKFMVFTGGTALRIIFGVRRFSEVLDFSLIKKGGFSFPEVNEGLVKGFSLAGLQVESKAKVKNTVVSSLLKFPGLLKQLGLSPLASQNLSIKVEVDSNPPKGGNIQNSLIQKFHIFNIVHFDLPSMYATKLHACFYRKYVKGRDFYDFIWYMANRAKPNLLLLNNAIEQTQGTNPKINEVNFKEFLLKGIERVDFNDVRKDVERFLEDKAELRLLDVKNIRSSIESIYG